MNIFKRTGKAIARRAKAFTLIFSTQTTSTRRLYTGSSLDYKRLTGDGTQSSVVMATVNWSARTFPEAPVVVSQLTAEGPERVDQHPMVTLIEAPNPFYSGVLMWMATRVDWLVNGNAYWLIARADDRRPVQLWWMPSSSIEPKWPSNGSEFVSHYEYTPDGGKPYRIEASDLVHFRYGMDPNNPRKGLSPIGSVLREVYTDDEAAQYTATILKNLGIPGLIIAPRGDDIELSDEDALDLKQKAKERFGGDNRGEPMVMQTPTDVTVLGWNPQQMNLRELRRVPEERVTAILGIPAIVVGLGAGLDRSTFANFEEARQAAYESHIIPDQRLFAAELRMQLLPEFSDFATHQVTFDNSGVRVLQDDVNALYERAGVAAQRGLITVNDFLRQVGQPVKPDGDVYLRPMSTLVVPEGESAEQAVDETVKALRLTEGKAAGNPAAQLIPKAERALRRFLDGQGKRVADSVAALDSLDDWKWDERELDRLEAVLKPFQVTAADSGWDAALDRIGGKTGKQLPDSRDSRRLLAALGKRIVGIDETTRLAIAELIASATAGDISPRELSSSIASTFSFSPARASTIARTEMANAANEGAIAAWDDSGIVKEVDILDGDGCGWTSHDDGDEAHGSRRTLDEFRENTLAHPNCVRVALPVVE